MKKGLNPTVPVDPLASLDIFGQQRFSIQEPHLTKIIELLQNLNQNLIFVNRLSILFIKNLL
ncbi:hypothetical protein CAB88_30335 (plasmid) [Bacillus thuringiensis]|uniref:Uncharacterized protein n=1 Tax=Bacillus thuringiensis TaxID=1428 RepID=A0A1W6WXM4_BACTU|nr:hypothetical protein CAB88_30335 [Bacillus thuringiensis]AST04982.1 hypothetical protein BT10792_30385 [Bacillus thuringiensis]OTW39739.1 hypothetical protein BK698_20110 [Bacillus thuringiensis serovar thuringiensis]